MRALRHKLSIVILAIACTPAFADSFDNPDDPKMPLQGYKYRWMLGFDVDTQIIRPQNDFKSLTYNYNYGSTLYVAWRSRGPFGLEFGYNWSTDKPQDINTVAGQSTFGATAANTTTYQCKLRIENTYFDAYWHYKLKKIVELKIGPGVGFVRENMMFYGIAGSTDPVALALGALDTTTTIVARFNIGLQTMLTRRIGARALFGYQTTNSIQVRNAQAGVDPHMFGNSYMFSLGLFFTMTGYYNDNTGPNGEFIN